VLHNESMARLRGEEAWAQAMISAELGLPVEKHDDGSSPGMYDLRIDPKGRWGAVEVTAYADPESTETWNLMNGSKEVWVVDGLSGGWLVTVLPSCRVRQLKAELPTLLRRLEATGITSLDLANWPTSAWLEPLTERLGIASAHQEGTSQPGSVYLTLELASERVGALVSTNGDAIAAWCGDFLCEPKQADVLDKLRRSGASERHAFIFVPGLTPAPWPVPDLLMADPVPLPTLAPDLASEVTHAWVTSTWSTTTGLRWSPDAGWRHFSKTVVAADVEPCGR
jgi:hypothetical protein